MFSFPTLSQSADIATALGNVSGVGSGNDFNIALMMAWMIFGGVGFVAFVYGKKEQNYRALVIGLVLMIYPYFGLNTMANYVVGILLCVALYVFRE